MYCFLHEFSKARYIHLEKITHWKKFSSERNWEQMKKLDSFCKKLSASQVNFSVEMREGKISACFYLTLL